MLINITTIEDPEVKARITDFDQRGGGLVFQLFRIAPNYEGKLPESTYQAHQLVARQTMEWINYTANFHWNKLNLDTKRSNYPFLRTDFEKLDSSGKELSPVEFMGPFYDWSANTVLVRGVGGGNPTINSFFYPDQEEIPANAVAMNQRIQAFEAKYTDSAGNFVYAFLEPPYSPQIGETIQERGAFANDLIHFLFSDPKQLQIYAWSTDCSAFFEAGKEWWGSFFWTVYNPNKDWYVGICGSETD